MSYQVTPAGLAVEPNALILGLDTDRFYQIGAPTINLNGIVQRINTREINLQTGAGELAHTMRLFFQAHPKLASPLLEELERGFSAYSRMSEAELLDSDSFYYFDLELADLDSEGETLGFNVVEDDHDHKTRSEAAREHTRRF